MKKLVFYLCLFTILIAGCQPTTFRISKDNTAYYLGTENKVLYEMLCDNGDFRKILMDTEMSDDIKEDFYMYVCTEKRSKEKVVSLYTSLTPEEKKSLKRAFVRHGYSVNSAPCCE